MKAARAVTAAVLISGNGSNLQAIIDAVDSGRLDLDLCTVVSNRADAYGLERARNAGIDAHCVSNRDYANRDAFDAALSGLLAGYEPDLVLLAGFMRILGRDVVRRYTGRMLNIHPSLLPLYPGLDTHARALAAGDRWHGSTVHFVTDELDGGPRIIQGRVPVEAGDDPDVLAARVLAVEHEIYPRAAALFADGRLTLANGVCVLDGKPLDEPLLYAGD